MFVWLRWKLEDWLMQKKICHYLATLWDGSLNLEEQKAFLEKFGHEVGLRTPSNRQCGNPECACSRMSVSHHMYWLG